MYGIDREFDGIEALYMLELASRCIGPGSQLWPQQRVLDTLPSLENLEIDHPSVAIRRTPYPECPALQALEVIEIDSLGRDDWSVLHNLPSLRMGDHGSVQ
jgi:hypothetical protein